MTNALKLDLSGYDRFQRLYVGFSGGLDSTVLMQLLAQTELKSRIHAIHIHHGVSVNANQWLKHCQKQCQKLDVPIQIFRVNIALTNFEQNAREARHQVFVSLLSENDAILLAHHADDQAETLLLNILRGAGIQGAAAMLPNISFGQGTMLRPLLNFSRQMLHDYALEQDYQWIDDESNDDTRFSRNYLRHQIMPLLKHKWPNCVQNMTQFSKNCQDALVNLTQIAQHTQDLSLKKLSFLDMDTKDRPYLLNLLYSWLTQHKIKIRSSIILNQIIDEVILARADAMPHINFGENILRRYKNALYLTQSIPEPKTIILCDNRLSVRFRAGGEVMRYHGQTQSLKKLFQVWEVPPWERDQIPLVYFNKTLIAVSQYALSDDCPDFFIQDHNQDHKQNILCLNH